MGDKIKMITEKTLLPVSMWVIIIGLTVWLTTLSAKTDSNIKDISEAKAKQEIYNQNLMEINTRLSHIEGKVDVNAPSH